MTSNAPSPRVRKAVVPAAGLGTRFLPVTKSLAKELLPLVDKPAIQWVVEEASRAGLRDVLFVTSRTKKAVEDHFDRSPDLERALEESGKGDEVKALRALAELADIHTVRQHEPGGLGQAVGLAAQHVGDEAFAVLLPDDLMVEGSTLLADMLAVHERHGGIVLALKRFPADRIGAYGVVAIDGGDGDGKSGNGDVVTVTDLVEKPDPDSVPSDLAIMGRYVLPPEIFAAIQQTAPGAKGEVQLTDAMRRLVGTVPVHGVVFDEGRYDTGDKLDWLRATVEVALAHPELGDRFREALTEIVRREGLAG